MEFGGTYAESRKAQPSVVNYKHLRQAVFQSVHGGYTWKQRLKDVVTFSSWLTRFEWTSSETRTRFEAVRGRMLYLIGLGLGDAADITVKGLQAVKSCSRVYLEAYTSILTVGKEALVSPIPVFSSGSVHELTWTAWSLTLLVSGSQQVGLVL